MQSTPRDFVNIAVYHPAGISDTLMATPVTSVLKTTFPAARVTWLGLEAISDLLVSFCPTVDDVVVVEGRAGWLKTMQALRQLKPDLVVFLTRWPGGVVLPLFSRASILERQALPDEDIHLVDDFLYTLAPLSPTIPDRLFPTIFPEALTQEVVALLSQTARFTGQPLIGLVPGVGATMTHKSWLQEGWNYLISYIINSTPYLPVLVGAESDRSLCAELADGTEGKCANLCGRLSLVKASVLIRTFKLLIAPDCGLLHLAVAVGTPVIGLYGPTASVRRGPYGYSQLAIDHHYRCECAGFASCHNMGLPGAGNCMRTIGLEQVIALIEQVGRSA